MAKMLTSHMLLCMLLVVGCGVGRTNSDSSWFGKHSSGAPRIPNVHKLSNHSVRLFSMQQPAPDSTDHRQQNDTVTNSKHRNSWNRTKYNASVSYNQTHHGIRQINETNTNFTGGFRKNATRNSHNQHRGHDSFVHKTDSTYYAGYANNTGQVSSYNSTSGYSKNTMSRSNANNTTESGMRRATEKRIYSSSNQTQHSTTASYKITTGNTHDEEHTSFFDVIYAYLFHRNAPTVSHVKIVTATKHSSNAPTSEMNDTHGNYSNQFVVKSSAERTPSKRSKRNVPLPGSETEHNGITGTHKSRPESTPGQHEQTGHNGQRHSKHKSHDHEGHAHNSHTTVNQTSHAPMDPAERTPIGNITGIDHGNNGGGEETNWVKQEAMTYIKKIFRKYGEDEVLYFEAFEHLMQNLGLGQLSIEDHDIHDHKIGSTFVEFHESHDHANSSGVETDDHSEEHSEHEDNEHHHGDSHEESREEHDHHGDTEQHEIVRRAVDLQHGHDHALFDDICMSPQDILYLYRVTNENKSVTVENFLYICPAILYQIEEDMCQTSTSPCPQDHVDWTKHCADFHGQTDGQVHGDDHHDDIHARPIRTFLDIPGKVWGFAVLSVTVISLVGLLCVAVIPVMNKVLYNHLVQFLVALAIGTLTGDALLHLIPHALVSHDESSHDESENNGGGHNDAVWKGLVVLGGAYLFFIMERLMAIVTERRKQNQLKKKLPPGEDVHMKSYEEAEVQIGEKLSHHHRDSLYISIHNFNAALRHNADEDSDNDMELQELHTRSADDGRHDDGSHSGNSDHGHSHNHGHSHSVPGSVSSIAWMVIMGDGLHNFSDGLAIGAAFSSSITVGLSTSIAVFCHELPHELGDFAVLLKAGMSVKHALFYNIVSSVLAFLGMLIGVAVGNISSASGWVFAMTAGIFIYIALVDMMPEITLSENSHKIRRSCCHLVLQIFGISTGVAIMLVIALYESQIKVG